MKTLKKSSSEVVLTGGDGGSPAVIPPPQPLSSPQLDANPRPSSALARDTLSTHHGEGQSSNGKRNVLTGGKGSATPNSTLVGTANWVLTFLLRRNLIQFGLVRDADGNPEYYQARFPVSTWALKDTLLVLTDGLDAGGENG